MTITLVALEADTNVGARLHTALRFAELTASHVEAVLVPSVNDADEHIRALLEEAGVPMRHLEGTQVSALIDAVSDHEVLAAVVGTRQLRSSQYPVRSTVRSLLERTRKPIVIVPGDAEAPATLQRLLVPLDGAESSTRAVLDQLLPLCAKPVELTVLHVFTTSTMPTMLDHPARDLEILGKEFLLNHLPHVQRIELRLGPIGKSVCQVSSELSSDLVVLSWSQNTSKGRGLVIQEVLSATSLPVLLLPIPKVEKPFTT